MKWPGKPPRNLLRCLLPVALLAALAASATAGIQQHSFEAVVTTTVGYQYLLFCPASYEEQKDRKWPLVVFLHGAGERVQPISALREMGPLAYVKDHPDAPFMVAAPHCTGWRDWSPDAVARLVEELKKSHRVDPDRIYLTGWSMGGAGTWETAMDHALLFAAIAPVAGRAIPLLVGNLWKMPVWVFHAEDDDVVPVSHSDEMHGYLRSFDNPSIRFTRYSSGGHDITRQVYGSAALYDWLLQFSTADEAREDVNPPGDGSGGGISEAAPG